VDRIEIAEDVAAVVGEHDLEMLLQRAAAGYECPTCGGSARLEDGPASVVVMQSGDLTVARVAHAACERSQIVQLPPDALRVSPDMPAMAAAAVLQHVSGPRPALIVEPSATASTSEHGERVDLITSGLLRDGLHLISAVGRTPKPASGWRLELAGPSSVRVGTDASWLYEGEVNLPPMWLQLVGERGGCLLLCATGLGLGDGVESLGQAARRLTEAARQGRLVGGLVPVITAA
jgi:hypothetical protein